MGRSVMVHPRAEATAYRHISNCRSTCIECDADNCEQDAQCPECGADMYDASGDVARDEFDCLIDWVREEFKSAFPSMEECDRWASGFGAMNELRCIVANQLCDVFISKYCGMVAISVVPTGSEGCYGYSDNTAGLATHWCATYAGNVLDRFNEFQRLGSMSNGETVYERRASA